MKILVTGGAGYIGSVLVPMLLNEGHEVKVLDSLMYGGHGLLSVADDIEFIKGDVRDYYLVEKTSRGCDFIIHLAAIVGFPACRINEELSYDVNVQGTKNVVDTGIPVLFASTGSNYGAVTDAVCTENTPLNPVSVYGKSKVLAESYVMKNPINTSFRFATAFGMSPRMRLDLMVNDFVNTALKQKYLVVYEPDFMRSFIHVHDMARVFIHALKNDMTSHKVYNVGDERMNFSKREVCQLILEQIDYYLHFAEVGTDGDLRNYFVSYDKINKTGFKTTVNMKDGIRQLINGIELISLPNTYSNV